MPATKTPASNGSPSRPSHAPSYRGKPVDVVIDVRSKLEFWLGHLEGATCIPVAALAARLPLRVDIRPDTRILVYCASGARSAAAATQLRALGYRHVTDAGAMSAAARDYAPAAR
jgi:rhodanese-related sulfurtransferase